MQIALINRNGLKQIAEALGQYHKQGQNFNDYMLRAWAEKAEDNFSNGFGCSFEIRSIDSISGVPVEIVITADGYDILEVNNE